MSERLNGKKSKGKKGQPALNFYFAEEDNKEVEKAISGFFAMLFDSIFSDRKGSYNNLTEVQERSYDVSSVKDEIYGTEHYRSTI